MSIKLKRLLSAKSLAILLTPFAILGSLYVYQQKTKTARAFGHLYVDLGVPSGQPVFTVANMLPGDCTPVKTISVENQGSGQAQIAVRSDNEIDQNGLSEMLNLVITADSNTLYQNTLYQFFADSDGEDGVPLSPLPAGESVSYDFEICFNPEAGNEYQSTQVTFDLIFGEIISPIELPQECAHLAGVITSKIEGQSRVRGTRDNELIIGTDGQDKLDGGGGHDCIVGGLGNDDLEGGAGNDVVIGGDGNDKLGGDSGNDRIYGGPGNDVIKGGSKDDQIWAGPGNDKVDGNSGDDIIYGEDGNDSLDGGSGNDTLDGGNHIDYAKGNTGTDTCIAETVHKSCEQ